MAGWQRHLQSLVQVAKKYNCSYSASFSTFNQAKASFVSGAISSLPSVGNSLHPTISRAPFQHIQKSGFTSTRILLGPEKTKTKQKKSPKVINSNNTRPKMFKGRMGGLSSGGNHISFGTYALRALEPAWITSRQIEAGRRAITRLSPRGGKVWVRLIPDKPITLKPSETRMGRGKGSTAYWVAVVKPGRILYEVGGISEAIAKRAIQIAASKMPINTKFIALR